jgi:hypothetical protein
MKGAATLPHNLHSYVSAKPPCRPAIHASAAAACSALRCLAYRTFCIVALRLAAAASCCSTGSASSCCLRVSQPFVCREERASAAASCCSTGRASKLRFLVASPRLRAAEPLPLPRCLELPAPAAKQGAYANNLHARCGTHGDFGLRCSRFLARHLGHVLLAPCGCTSQARACIA